MKIQVRELAVWLEAELEGDAEAWVQAPARIEDAGEGDISFLANPRYHNFASSSKATALIVSKDFKGASGAALLRVSDPYLAFARVLQRFAPKAEPKSGIADSAVVDPTAEIDPSAWVGALAYVGPGVRIGASAQIHEQVYLGDAAQVGAGSILHSGVKVYDHCIVGESCILHSGAVIGSDGFGFTPGEHGLEKIPQTGNVVLESHVEVGANSCIDRAVMGSTVLKAGVKVDNLVQIAHNVEVGSFTVLAAQSGIAGSTKLGQGCQVGGQAGFIGHLEIADGTKVNAQSGVNRSVRQPGTALTGSPAGNYQKELRNQVVYRKLPELDERIRQLELELSRIKPEEK
jgi:UDP-3-O-[3-hydroxymyristoyl] glucosamine N-acyltransferase